MLLSALLNLSVIFDDIGSKIQGFRKILLNILTKNKSSIYETHNVSTLYL